MAPLPSMGSRERSSPGALRRLLDNLRSQLTWLDFLTGLGAASALAAILVVFRYQTVPSYKPGDISKEEIRAVEDISYPDPVETERKREAARNAEPVVYDLDSKSGPRREAELARVFETGRRLLLERRTPRHENLTAGEQNELVAALIQSTGISWPREVLEVFVRQRFAPALEAQIVRMLGAVQRGGIVADRGILMRDLKAGVLVRDPSTSSDQRLSEADPVRDVASAREYLRQFALEFAELSERDRRTLFTFLESLISPNLVPNPEITQRRREAAAAAIMPVDQTIKKGKTIVRMGDEVSEAAAAQLQALRRSYGPRSMVQQYAGYWIVAATLLYALWRYFVHHQSRHLKIRRHAFLITLILLGALATVRLLTALADILSERVSIDVFRDPTNLYYAIPFAFSAVLVTLLVDTNLGIFSSTAMAILAGLYYGDVYIAAYIFVGSLAGIYSIRQYKDRAAILKAGLTMGLVNMLALVAIDLVRQAQPTGAKMLIALSSGILASAIASILLPALESLFKITTDIRLLELSNLNAPILRRLSVEAPGTYHHSLMVGTLAEAAAEAIGANPLLVRVGAYYHDLGKMLKPEYFIENQIFGMNKHEKLSPTMSCLIIASHVKDGLELAKEIGLAERIRDMIPQHHGTRIMTYFYQKAKDSLGPEEVVETDFRYPGPKPQSKEAAIMMMADSVEAASRTLTNPTASQIQGMINRLVDAIVADNQFDECDITLREVRLVKESFFKILSGIYHRRIDYPGYDFKESGTQSDVVQSADPQPAKAL